MKERVEASARGYYRRRPSQVERVRPFDRFRRGNARARRPLQPLRGHEHGPIIFDRGGRLETAR
jgi:hypothetical protein